MPKQVEATPVWRETVSNKASGDFRTRQHRDEAPVFLHHPIIKAERSAEWHSKNSRPELVLLGQHSAVLDYCSATAAWLSVSASVLWRDRQAERERKFLRVRAHLNLKWDVGAKLEDWKQPSLWAWKQAALWEQQEIRKKWNKEKKATTPSRGIHCLLVDNYVLEAEHRILLLFVLSQCTVHNKVANEKFAARFGPLGRSGSGVVDADCIYITFSASLRNGNSLCFTSRLLNLLL